MRWRRDSGMEILWTILAVTAALAGWCDGARRTAQRRKDTSPAPGLREPLPSTESLQLIAQAMGAAGFEHYAEGTPLPLVKRLIPAASPDADVVEHQGVIGKAGVDFPAYPSIPSTGFNCKNVPTGYYADLETDCQVFHICDTSRKISFLCPNGTIFSQSHLICDWWFKVDCASAPALYESSAEYYSNEQKKTQKITQSLSKVQNLQQLDRAESRRTPVNIPSTTERLLRHRQRLQSQTDTPYNVQATARSYQALFPDANYNPTQRSQLTTAFENRRKNLVQLISNNFAFTSRSTKPTFYEASTLKTTPIDHNFKEMQEAAETASFAANNNNRQFLQDYNSKNYRPYPVYTPNVTPKPKLKSNPNLTTLYDIRDKDPHASNTHETTKRPTLVPYTKSYTTANDPYTRPGVSLLKSYINKEKNKTLITTTEKAAPVTEKIADKATIENNAFESVTKIPTTRSDRESSYFSETASSDRYDVYSTTKPVTEVTTEPSYKERRERLMRKLNLDSYGTTEPTLSVTPSEKFQGDQSRSGLVIPASSSKTLHNLAIYYATALDNLSTAATSEEIEATTPAFDYEAMEEALPALFSSNTINKYSNLFGQGVNNAELLEELKEDPNGTYNELMEDLMVQQSQSPLATSPQIRELAQVFTHALSAYLQDPVQFRKVLSDIRPTQPTFGELGTTTEEPANTEPTTTVYEDDDEILGFSEDNKASLSGLSGREPKALDVASKYQTIQYEDVKVTTHRPTEASSTTFSYTGTSARNPFRCCGKISASYTSAPTPLSASTTPIPFTNTVAFNINTLANNYSEVTTTDSYSGSRYGGFQNNDPYGNGISSTHNKPLSEYVEATNLPTAWGIDASPSTSSPVSSPDFESKKIRTTTAVPTTTAVYFTETDSIELENDEQLQRAHSQSFVGPQNNARQGKQLNLEESSTVKRPSEDLEAPTLPDEDQATTVQTTPQPTTYRPSEEISTTTQVPSSIFTSPDFDKTTYPFLWSSTFDNWQSTVIDPITLNDGLSHTAAEDINTDVRDTSYTYNTATTPTIDYATTEQAVSSTSNIELTTYGTKADSRRGKALKDLSTEPAQDLTTDTIVEKAKEIMGGMNSTTTEKLMNVMKKTKSKTVKRLILLLVQTCDDDHNSTAEASKKALLEALMAVSQQDMDEIAKDVVPESSTPEYDSFRRADRFQERPRQDRRGKSLNFDPSAINSLSNPTTESIRTTEEPETTSTSTTQSSKTTASRRGVKKFGMRTTPTEVRTTKPTFVDSPKAEARTAVKEDLKTASDTRALELLRSLYTIAARWG